MDDNTAIGLFVLFLQPMTEQCHVRPASQTAVSYCLIESLHDRSGIYEDPLEGHAIYPFLWCTDFYACTMLCTWTICSQSPAEFSCILMVCPWLTSRDIIHNGSMKTITVGMSLKCHALGHAVPSVGSLQHGTLL